MTSLEPPLSKKNQPRPGGLSLVPAGQPRGFAPGAGHEPETGAGPERGLFPDLFGGYPLDPGDPKTMVFIYG